MCHLHIRKIQEGYVWVVCVCVRVCVCANVTVIKERTTNPSLALQHFLSFLCGVAMAAASVWQSCENEADWIKILSVIRGQEYGTSTKHTSTDLNTHTHTDTYSDTGRVVTLTHVLDLFSKNKTGDVSPGDSHYPILIKFPVKDSDAKQQDRPPPSRLLLRLVQS